MISKSAMTDAFTSGQTARNLFDAVCISCLALLALVVAIAGFAFDWLLLPVLATIGAVLLTTWIGRPMPVLVTYVAMQAIFVMARSLSNPGDKR